jgi:hypothetical protein
MLRHTLLLLIIVLSGCDSIKKTVKESYKYEMYIDFKNISYQGKNSTQSLYLAIDSTNGMWYNGKLIIDQRDTLFIRGFEKGRHYPTTYKRTNATELGGLDIWCMGETGRIRDSLTVQDFDERNGSVREKTTLYRRPGTICY